MADQMKPTPRSTILGLFSDVVNLPLEYMSSPERTQQMQGAAQFLYGTGIPKTLERMSYGDSLFTGSGMTLRPREETINAAMNVAPFAPAVGRLAGRAVRATEGLPVGMGIKDVGKGITSNISQFTGFKNTTPYGKAKEVAAYLDRLNIPYTINKSKTTNSAYLEIQTGKGDFDYPMQFRFSDHSTDLPHQNRQIFTNPKPDPNFDLDVFKDGGHDAEFAVNKINELAKKVKPQPVSQRSPYPQQAALDLAQERAALPIEQGGLGLPANNTPEMRAAAMGFEGGYVHGSPNPDITNLRPSITGAQGEGIYSTNYLPEANMYSGTKEGATNYPLYVKTQNALDVGENNPYDVLGFDLQSQLSQRQKDAIISKQKETEDWLIKNGVPMMPSREHYVSTLPENFRSRFAAFDPFRRDVATATAMGVAAPDLLAQPVDQYQIPQDTTPMYTDPFGNTIGSSIR